MSKPSRIRPGIWKIVLYVAVAHGVAILILSPQFYCSNENSPETLFAQGEQAMTEGKHVEAMQYFRQVMDQQPKPPPIYARAAEQHRLADRLARQDAGKRAQDAEKQATNAQPTRDDSEKASAPTSQPATAPATPRDDSSKPDAPFIPPELRR